MITFSLSEWITVQCVENEIWSTKKQINNIYANCMAVQIEKVLYIFSKWCTVSNFSLFLVEKSTMTTHYLNWSNIKLDIMWL